MKKFIELKITFKNGVEKVYLMNYVKDYNDKPSTVPNSIIEFARKGHMLYGILTKDNVDVTINLNELLFIESRIVEK